MTSPAETMGVFGFDIGVEETILVPRRNFPLRENGLFATGYETIRLFDAKSKKENHEYI